MILKELKTSRLTLRMMKEEDIPYIAKYGNDEEIARNTLVIPYPYTLEDAKKFYEKTQENYDDENKGGVYVLDLNGEFIGVLGLHDVVIGCRLELGYWCGRPFWGKGYMSEALKAVSEHLLENDFARVHLMTFPWNDASSRVAEKAGFEYEGTLRNYEKKKDGQIIDARMYSKIK